MLRLRLIDDVHASWKWGSVHVLALLAGLEVIDGMYPGWLPWWVKLPVTVLGVFSRLTTFQEKPNDAA